MPYFSYTALDNDGGVIKGRVRNNDMGLACDHIESSGLHLVKIRQLSILSEYFLNQGRRRGVKRNEIIEFAGNLAVMAKAGLPLNTSIRDIAETIDNKIFRTRLKEVSDSIELGSSFSEALTQHRDIFPDIFLNLSSVGEETGRLDVSLSDVAVHLQRMEDLKSAIIRALMYPAFAFIGTIGALLFWLIYVLPKITELFTNMSLTIPPLTRALMAASDFSVDYWYIYLIIPASIYASLKLLSKHEKTKYYLDAAMLKMPVVKLITYNKMVALFSEQLRILFAAGVKIDRSLDIMKGVVNNIVFKRAITEIKEDILLGNSLTEALQKHDALFPGMVLRMLSIGETTGNIGEQLEYLSDHYLKKLDDISEKMGKLIEPIIIVIIGGIFLVIILGLIGPIYDLIGGVG